MQAFFRKLLVVLGGLGIAAAGALAAPTSKQPVNVNKTPANKVATNVQRIPANVQKPVNHKMPMHDHKPVSNVQKPVNHKTPTHDHKIPTHVEKPMNHKKPTDVHKTPTTNKTTTKAPKLPASKAKTAPPIGKTFVGQDGRSHVYCRVPSHLQHCYRPHTCVNWARYCWLNRWGCHGYYCATACCWYYWYEPYYCFLPVTCIQTCVPVVCVTVQSNPVVVSQVPVETVDVPTQIEEQPALPEDAIPVEIE